jgi:cephalosporin-C deacetylase-like acetyl esterase
MAMLSSTGSTDARDDAAGRHQAFLRFLKATAADISSQSLVDIQDLEHWRQQRPALLRELLYMLGLDPLPARTALGSRVTGVLQRPGYRIEKLVFQSMPGLYVTGNLYLPEGLGGVLPAILYPSGHSPHPLGAKSDYQDRGLWFAEHGYVCLVLDTLEFGEVAGIHHGIHDLNMWYWLSLGYTPLGVEVWNAIRALDYLESRPEVDRTRIGMTGISGGGATTWFTAAVDERVAVAAPTCSTYTFGSQAAHWVAAGQCDCIYFHNTYLRDFPVVGALISPRPLIISSGKHDADFPPDGYHEVFARVRHIYDLYGPVAGSDRIREVDDDVGHADSPPLRREVRQWMNRWLKDDLTPLPAGPNAEEKPETAEDLACLHELPVDAVNYHIHKGFTATARVSMPDSLPAWQQRRDALLGELRDRVFRWFPTAPVPFNSRALPNDGGWATRYADYTDVVFESERQMPIRAQLLRPRGGSSETPLLICVKRPGDSIYPFDFDELLPVLGRDAVLLLNARLTEHPVSASEYAEIERTASWIGRTVAAMQVWDIVRTVHWVTQEAGLSPSSISVYGKGGMGILALYAGLLEERIDRIVLEAPPISHWDGPALLNVLRVTDIPEVAAAFAPREMVFLGEVPAGMDAARRAYDLYRCPDHMRSAPSLAEALEIWRRPLR